MQVFSVSLFMSCINKDYYYFSKFSILIGWQAVRKNPYPDRGPYFPYLDRMSFIWREIFALQTEKIFAF
jgi:hypothetical protein